MWIKVTPALALPALCEDLTMQRVEVPQAQVDIWEWPIDDPGIRRGMFCSIHVLFIRGREFLRRETRSAFLGDAPRIRLRVALFPGNLSHSA
ncbi:hypothetical protein ACFXCZ_09075 [Streptomyces sp. NPDC059396]|uniref:hypothetical protein n=1 Tax=Streptomyces sp. NPDC059396 TaxID=3346819 RepID=UPI0036BD3A3C